MQVQKVDNSNPNVAFNGLNRDAKTMSEEVFKRVIKTDMLQSFGEKFDATIGIDYFMSSRRPGVRRMALVVDDIKPLTFIGKVKGFFFRKPKHIVIKTSATDEKSFIVSVSSHPINRLTNRMK